MTNTWYAVVRDSDDNDWGTGSRDLDEAQRMAEDTGAEAYVVEIDDGPDPVAVREIKRDKFGEW